MILFYYLKQKHAMYSIPSWNDSLEITKIHEKE